MLEETKNLENKISELGHVYVSGEGNPTARLWIVGEAPGEEEAKARRPFIGRSGNLLNPCLGASGVRRDGCYVTNVSPVRPPRNEWKRLGDVGVTHEECYGALREQITAFKPNCILALGENALFALTGKKGITSWRGYIQEVGGVKVVGSFHPAYILRMGEKSAKKERESKGGIKYTYGSARITLILDAKRAKEESETKGVSLPKMPLGWDWSQKEELEGIRRMKEAKEVAFDVENKGTWLNRISFSSNDEAFSIPLDVGEFKYEIKEQVKGLLETHGGLVAQYGESDISKLKREGIMVRGLYADTLIAHQLLYPEFPHSLDYLASIYVRLSEPPHCPDWNLPENIGRKNAEHAFLTMEIWKKLEGELREIGGGIK